jgi:hypothetical protein
MLVLPYSSVGAIWMPSIRMEAPLIERPAESVTSSMIPAVESRTTMAWHWWQGRCGTH